MNGTISHQNQDRERTPIPRRTSCGMRDGGITQHAELRIIKYPAKYTGHRNAPSFPRSWKIWRKTMAENLKASAAR